MILTPPQTAGILDGINRKSIIQIAARPRATRSSSATSRGPSCTSPTRCSCPAPRPSSCRCARSTTTRSATASRGPITREIQRVFDDALHGRDPALRRLARRGQGADVEGGDTGGRRAPATASRRMTPRSSLRHDPARRHAGRGDVALGAGEAARRAPPRRARDRPDRGRLPELEPQGARAVRAARAASVRARRRSPPSG